MFVEISVHQSPQRCCRSDISAFLKRLHQSIFVMHQTGPEQSMYLRSQGQHTGSDISILVKEALVNNTS